MLVDLTRFNLKNKIVAIALSGGCDSVCLVHLMKGEEKRCGFTLKAINVEHGIRGEQSKKDSLFVKNLCEQLNVELLSFTVDAPFYSQQRKLTLEEGARELRYQSFYTAIENGFCDLVATAHHQKDNAETVLLNIFRGCGINGLCGITDRDDKIIRPLINTDKKQIDKYVKDNNLAYVQDETNLSDEYTRNYIRLNILPVIEKVFPEAEKSISRLSEIARCENQFLNKLSSRAISIEKEKTEIVLPLDTVLLKRAVIICLKSLGLEKDWEKAHIDSVCELATKQNGKEIVLPKGLVAIKNYDKITILKLNNVAFTPTCFCIGENKFQGKTYRVEKVFSSKLDLKQGLYLDLDKISASAKIRKRKKGDVFTKFGGGTKSLSDYLTDIKMPKTERDKLLVVAENNTILAIFGVAISENVKVDSNTKNIIKLTIG